MRVLYYLDTVNRGGAEMLALDVCRNAHKFGLEITLVVAGGGALEPEMRDSGVEFIRLQRKFPVDLYLVSQLRKIVIERRIQVIHGHQPVDGLHLYLASRSLKNVKKVVTFHGFITDRKNRVASRYIIPKMDANIVVSQALKNWIQNHDKLKMNDRTLIVHNGADPARLKPRGHSIRRELGIADDANLIGMVANFYRDDRKDQLTVCRALPDVLDRFPDTHCFFAGRVEDGGEEKLADCLSVCIENEIADRVHFLGARNDVPDLLAETDIFVFSTLYEGLPIAVCEAMLTGVPIVASDIEPLMEISRDGEFAEIFPVRDAAALSERLSLLISDDDRRNGLAMRAKAFADSHYSISAHLVSLRSLYERLLA